MVLATTLAACAGGSGPSEGESIEGTTIRVTLSNHVWTEAIKQMIPEFEEQSGAKVEVTQLAEDQLSDQYNVRLNAGSDEIDVLMYRPLQENKLFASNGYLSDLTDVAQADTEWDWSDFQEAPASLTTFEDQIVGVPIITERTVLYYRKDLLEKSGLEVPTTLEELEAAAEKIHEDNPEVAGYVGRTGKSAAVTQFSAFLHSYGGEWNDGETSQIGSPESREAYEYYGRLIRDYTDATINPEMSWSESFAVFQQGQAAFIADADSLYKNMTDPTQSTVSDNVGFAPFPEGPAGSKPYNVAAWALAVNEASQNQSGAWEFIKWATSKEASLKLAEQGVSGARQSTWDDPAATAEYPEELLEAIKVNAANGIPSDRPLVVEVAKAREIVGEPIVVAIAGGDVNGAVDSSDAAFNEFLIQDSE